MSGQPDGVEIEHTLRYFEYEHLPQELALVSSPFSDLASDLAHRFDRGEAHGGETLVALRKLLEAKDAAVRAALPPR